MNPEIVSEIKNTLAVLATELRTTGAALFEMVVRAEMATGITKIAICLPIVCLIFVSAERIRRIVVSDEAADGPDKMAWTAFTVVGALVFGLIPLCILAEGLVSAIAPEGSVILRLIAKG